MSALRPRVWESVGGMEATAGGKKAQVTRAVVTQPGEGPLHPPPLRVAWTGLAQRSPAIITLEDRRARGREQRRLALCPLRRT